MSLSDDIRALIIAAIYEGLSNEQIATRYEDTTVGQIKAVRAHVTMGTYPPPPPPPPAMSLLEQYEATLAAPSPAIESTLLTQVDSCRQQPTLHEEAYAAFLAQNRPHQTAALQAIQEETRGQVIIPTGTGKTRVEVALHVADMIEKTKQGKKGVFVIASHRLLLNKQLMDGYQDLCIACGLPINVLYVGSAIQDDKAVYDKYFEQGIDKSTFESTYTTKGSEVRAFADKTKAAGRHLIVVSTYHSFDRLQSLDAIDICTYDEAHNTTNEDFTANIKAVIPKIARNYFFTATRKTCIISGHGMENEEIYGRVICEIGPREMIEKGEMVKPRITTMMLDDEETPTGVVSENNQHMLVKTIIEASRTNRELVKANSALPETIGSKILVSFVGSKELLLVQNSEEFKTWCAENNIKVFSFSSKFGAYSDFEEEVNRNKVYEEMRGLRDEDDAIFLHIDILAEGIDLPSITGVLLLRHLNAIKLFQTLGRALRLMRVDRQKLYSGEMGPQDTKKFVKPYAYLILPLHMSGMDTSSEDMKRTVQDVLSTYGIPVEEFLPPEGFRDPQDPKGSGPVPPQVFGGKPGKDYPLLSVVEDFVLNKFLEGLPTDPVERYNALMEMFKDFGKGGDADA